MTPEKHDIAVESVKAAPAVAGAVAASLTLNEWVAVATGIYIVVQIAYLIRKWWREETDWGAKFKRGTDFAPLDTREADE
ncbi:hypothetical protein [Xenophilus sp. Marseille-Q4582]|uniref:hypothetical protein n=1 Tax=Xenophilus sp. Marseille-Q4582 TaxID=2866600 RepID=UPI001CE42211|nr:hypothetical protein [Xenophilus sp. Marseille-Q4582]